MEVNGLGQGLLWLGRLFHFIALTAELGDNDFGLNLVVGENLGHLNIVLDVF